MLSTTLLIFIISLLLVFLHTLLSSITIPSCGALLIDALGHASIFGIAVTFLLVQDLSSPLLFLGAIASAILMNFLISFLLKLNILEYDTCIGVSFSFLFSIGIFIISLCARNIHLDLDMILSGNIEFAIYDRLVVNHVDYGPKIIYYLLTFSFLLLIFMVCFFEKIKLLLFDKVYLRLSGINVERYLFLIKLFSSIVIVCSFQSIGAILLVGIASSSFGMYWGNVKSYLWFIVLSIVTNLALTILAIYVALWYDLPLAATITFILSFSSIFSIVFLNKKGLINTLYSRYQLKKQIIESIKNKETHDY